MIIMYTNFNVKEILLQCLKYNQLVCFELLLIQIDDLLITIPT
jgi:hypothetical protein